VKGAALGSRSVRGLMRDCCESPNRAPGTKPETGTARSSRGESLGRICGAKGVQKRPLEIRIPPKPKHQVRTTAETPGHPKEVVGGEDHEMGAQVLAQ
jgi:hypothetical protein